MTPVSNDDNESVKHSSNYHVSPFKRIASQINFDLQSPDTEDLYTPESPKCLKNLMKFDSIGIQEECVGSNIEEQQQFMVFPESKGEMDDNQEDESKNISSKKFYSCLYILTYCIKNVFRVKRKFIDN